MATQIHRHVIDSSTYIGERNPPLQHQRLTGFKGSGAIIRVRWGGRCRLWWCARPETGFEDAGSTSSHTRVGYRMTVVSSRSCLGLEASVGLGRLITGLEGSPPRSCLRRHAPLDLLASTPFSFVSGWPDQAGSGGCAIWAIAQMKPTISRAMAVVTTTFGLPAARRRYLAHSRICAFHAMSRIAAGSGSRRS